MQATQSLMLNHPYGVPLGARVGGGMRLGPLDIRLVWPCKDGTVTITFLFGASAGPFSARLFEWISEEGGCDEATRDLDWIGLGNALSSGEVPISEFDRIKGLLADFCMTKTKQELLDAAMERKLLIAPASTIGDVFANDQFVERDYWDLVHEPELDAAIRYPGPFVQPSYGRLPTLRRPPRLGEHTDEVLAELDAAQSAAAVPVVPAVPAHGANGSSAEDRRPLAGVKILDFMWSLAGPQITRVLADCGATIVRVESSKKIEMGRTLNPFWQDKVDVEASGLFNNANAGKLGICLDLNTEAGRDVVRDLVRWADVVTESYSPRAMARWGLTYAQLREVNPKIVMMSSCLMGQTGPLAHFAGFGNLAAAFGGFFYTTGWPDRTPVGPYGGYTDYLSPRFAVASILAALERRERTGEGCYLDFSQAEASMWALGPAFADFEVNGRNWERAGNRDRNHAPHMVAPAAGDDRWLAIVCETDEQWRALCRLAGFDQAWAGLGRAERLARVDEIEDLVAGWTSTQFDHELAARLQEAGVPAHVLLDSEEVWKDPQLDHRGHFVEVDHASLGRIPIEGCRFSLSRTPVGPAAAGPTLGQHAWEILTDLCGYDDDRIADLAAAEVLE
jgi:crotonobetainyl-CoA:carnitine CoA-transferase CaiB-like acyl-CoA transferase